MADEITIQGQLRINNVAGGLPPLTHGGRPATVDQTNKEKVSLSLDLTTTTASIDLSSLTDVGYVYVENIGDTNDAILLANNATNDAEFCVIGPAVGYPLQLSTASTYKAKASSGTTTLVIEAHGV